MVDTSLFILNVNHDICYLLVYVDDILLTGSNSTLIQRLVILLSSEFKLQDLGNAHYFLGIEVTPTSMGLMLSQHKYALDILSHDGMSSCKPVDTLAFASNSGLPTSEPFSDPTCFCQIISALRYLTFTRPNICYVVNKVCQFMHAPTKSHWAAVKRILQYLKGTSSFGLTLLVAHCYHFMVLLMLIGWGALMIGSPRVATLTFSAPLPFHGNLASNVLLLAPPLKQNIKH